MSAAGRRVPTPDTAHGRVLTAREADARTAHERVLKDQPARETDALLSCDKPGYVFDYTLGLNGFMANLNVHFGHKLLWLLVATQFLLKGFAREFVGKADPYLYKLYHVPANRMQIFMGVTRLPWAMKPIIGLVSDIFPIYGFNKAPYMCITSAMGVVAFAIVGSTSPESLPVIGLVICFVFIQLQVAACDLLSEAKYAERIREVPAQGPSLLTYVWFGMTVGGLMAVVMSGIVISRLGPHANYSLAVIPAGLVLIPVAMNYMQETKLSTREASAAWAHFMSQGETIILCAMMFLGTMTLIVVGLTSESAGYPATAAVIVGVVLVIAFSVLLSPTIAKINAFSMIQSSLTLQVSGAAFYFYTDTPEQYPEGPHFTPFFYNSVVGAVTAICSLVGIYCYQRWMSTWKYRNIMIAANVGYALVCLPDLALFTRHNLVLGIPDHLFMLGANVAMSVVAAWQWMPQVVMLANLCPKGMEATMYALLAGSANLGASISENCGAFLLEWLECTPSGAVGEQAKFDNLWKAMVIASALPVITILALFWLIPDARQDESILDASCNSATHGSLWHRWTGRLEDPQV